MAYNPSQTTTWSRSTPNDGLLLEAEYNRIYGNTNYLYDNLTETLVKTSGYTILNTDEYQFYIGDTTSGAVGFVLPALASNYGKRFKIINVDGTNSVTVTRGGSDTITEDSLTSIELPKAGNFVELYASQQAGCWIILSENITSQIKLDTFSAYGSTDTKIMQFTNITENIGNFISENHTTGYSSGNEGLEFTINKSGLYSCALMGCADSANNLGLSLNSNQLTTAIETITLAHRIANATTGGGNYAVVTPVTLRFSKSDILRPHTDGATFTSSPQRNTILITYLGG